MRSSAGMRPHSWTQSLWSRPLPPPRATERRTRTNSGSCCASLGLGTRRYGMLKLRGAKGEGESHWSSELGTQIVKPSAPPPRQSCSCLCCGILVALLLCANLITMAPVLFQSEGGGTVLQVSVALGPQTGGQGRCILDRAG